MSRSLTSACPNCGAEIEFRWAQAVQATCPACRSVLVRRGVNLERVGTTAEVPRSMSRIQLGTEGRFKGKGFVVVGRIAYRYGRGHWSEWHLRMADGTSAWLSDAQGEYAVTRAVKADRQITEDAVKVGRSVQIAGKGYTVTTMTRARYAGVEGELPFEYWDRNEVAFHDLKQGTDGFATIDFSEDPPLVFAGEYESFEELRLTNLREEGDVEAVEARSLTCPQCGAGIELVTGDLARGVACVACEAVLSVGDEGLSVLQEHQSRMKRGSPAIPLGAVGTLKGVRWRVIGYQIRQITVDDLIYQWREYLLWNADQGFRYLTEYEGHWNEVTVLRGIPAPTTDGGHDAVEYLGQKFRHFQRARARTVYVLGEFPWEVRRDDEVDADDYVAPPLMLSREHTPEEVTWSLGTYTDPRRIQEAFRLKEPLRSPSGVFANQPNPLRDAFAGYLRMFGVFLVLLAVLFIGRRVTARNESAFAESYRHVAGTPGAEAAFTTRAFELRGGRGNVEISIDTDIRNSWAFFTLALLPEGGGDGFELGREVSYYYGVDGGESWREGSPADRAMLSAVPAGRYYLLVDVDRDPGLRQFDYEIRVRRDVPRAWPFLVGLLALALPPVLAFARDRNFEHLRWQESDYAVSDDEEE